MDCAQQDASIVLFCRHAALGGNRIGNIKIIYRLELSCKLRIGVNYRTINRGIPQALSKYHTLNLTIIIPANVIDWIMILNCSIKTSWTTINTVNVRMLGGTSRRAEEERAPTSCTGEFGSARNFLLLQLRFVFLGSIMVSVLTIGPKVREFKPRLGR
jgi:hypothetical protein